jgi:LysM repeat protein
MSILKYKFQSGGSYEIKKGDSLWKIAKDNKVDLDTLIENNNLKSDSLILPGQKLILNKPKETKRGLWANVYLKSKHQRGGIFLFKTPNL